MDDGYERPFEHLHDTEAGAKACKRVAVTREAETWLGTPYHHMGRVKGAGTDCLMMLAEVYEACASSRTWRSHTIQRIGTFHRDAEQYLDATAKRRRGFSLRPPLRPWGDRGRMAADHPHAGCR
jgi:hypothetical protein